MVQVRQDIRITEEFEGLNYSYYTADKATTDSQGMGRTPGTVYTFGLNTQNHLDIRTFANTPVQESWTRSPAGSLTVGAQPTYNHWPGLSAPVVPGSTTFVSSAGKLDLTQLGTTALITMALPAFPLSSITLASTFLDFSNDGFATTVASLAFSSSSHAPTAGNTYVSWPLSSLTGIDLTKVTDVRIRVAATGSVIFQAMAIRLIDPNWVAKDVDFDNWNGALRQCIPLDANPASLPVPNNQVLPTLWHASTPTGLDDPRPINSTFAVVFNTGSQTSFNSIQLNLRGVNGADETQLDLNNLIQAQLSGVQQPGLAESILVGRALSDFDNQPLSTLDNETMQDMDSTAVTVAQSWLAATIAWGSAPSISIGRSLSSTDGYQWSGGALTFSDGSHAFQNNTYYLAVVTLTDTTARIQIYQINQSTFAIGQIWFDSGIIQDSYRFIRRKGRTGWKATIGDGDSTIRSIRPESLAFAEYRSAPLNSNTPVQGVRIYAQFAPKVQLWTSWSAVSGIGNVTPTLTADSNRSTSGQSTRIDIVTPSATGQGIISNVLTTANDSVAGVVDWGHAEIDFNLWFPSSVLNAGGSLSLYLLSQDGNNVPLALPRIIPDQWQNIRAFAPAGLQSGRYQLGLTYGGTSAVTFWVDSVNVQERAVVWSARANPGDDWVDCRDELNSNSEGVLFINRGSQLQVRAQALRQDGVIIGSPKIVPIYAELGRPVWPEQIVADPYGGATAVISVGGSTVHGTTTTFDGSASTPSNGIINWLWSFGDGTSANGAKVRHVYQAAGTYQVSLSVVNAWGTRNITLATVAIS